MSNESNNNNADDSLVVTDNFGGGSVKVQAGYDEGQSSLPAPEMIKVGGGTYKLNSQDGTVTKSDCAKYVADPISEAQESITNGGSIIGTLRDTGGGRNIDGKNPNQLTVQTPMGQMSLGAAEVLGLVSKNAEGNWVDVSQSEIADAMDTTETPEVNPHTAPKFAPEVEAHIEAVVSDIGDVNATNILQQVSSRMTVDDEGILRGDINTSMLSDAQADVVHETMQGMLPLLSEQANNFLEFEHDFSDSDLNDYSQWFWSPSNAGMRSGTITKHFTSADMSGYVESIEAFRLHQRHNKKS